MGSENSNLSKTEIKIIKLLEKGLSNKRISSQLKKSENTVKFHLKNIYKKLKVKNRGEAVYKSLKKGIIDLK